jgi:hypothetical protein
MMMAAISPGLFLNKSCICSQSLYLASKVSLAALGYTWRIGISESSCSTSRFDEKRI